MKMYAFKFGKGQELVKSLEEEFQKHKLVDGAIVSIIGAVDKCCISNMPKNDAAKYLKQLFEKKLNVLGIDLDEIVSMLPSGGIKIVE